MTAENISFGGINYAQVIRGDVRVDKTQFVSPAESSFQFGLLAHEAGFRVPPHYHRVIKREISDLQEMFFVQRGRVVVEFYSENGQMVREIELQAGDGIVLIHGIHSLRVVEDFQAMAVKQGPFFGTENDKISVEVKKK